MIINDSEIINLFITNNKLNSGRLTNKWLNSHIEYKNYLLNRFSNCDTLHEIIYRIQNKIESVPKCKYCNNKVQFISFKEGYRNYCKDCRYKESVINSKKTCLEKYGVDKYSKTEQFKKSYKENNPMYNDDIKKKLKLSNIEKYGVDNVMKLSVVKEKQKKTCLQRYGVDNVFKISEIKEYLSSIRKETLEKIFNKKKYNKTFNTSKQEDYIYNYLISKFNVNDIIRQYKSDVYPFNCDFYIKSKDVYIECNFHWTHGKHLFNENNIDDLETLNKWKQKNTQYYRNAIQTWLIRDINKFNIAQENNLHYIILYNIKADLLKIDQLKNNI